MVDSNTKYLGLNRHYPVVALSSVFTDRSNSVRQVTNPDVGTDYFDEGLNGLGCASVHDPRKPASNACGHNPEELERMQNVSALAEAM